ncbi:Xyloglucan endotransglucosylase/hydrolase protein 2 [Morella rubra]|uniref:Xyloglucan endotransglucosylase/hydrolase n=1 Tax=Morella rubra TaxID=262757 RepID=A0A6A1W1S3_9ROSI|nr:Xyloglucan endotransglucosylase/hydrolase protein 2 [Morella rubra]KAB1216750.1 Xyloglucan endotransglucosylase/hydrolase protein 2 [Morella rubra]
MGLLVPGFSVLLLLSWVLASEGGDISFYRNYKVAWGANNVLSLDQGREIQLSMDASSGAGFASKLSYGSGSFSLRIKLPDRDSAGVVTAFYLTSQGNNHDELDFEFLGNREGRPYTLQTNVFANGEGNREQRTLLWFDPTADFHTYRILWNRHQIVFYVDRTPIRVFKNKQSIGVAYPSRPLQIEASLWDGDSWATDGGQTKTNWSYAPFKAYFKGFHISGCGVQNPADIKRCDASSLWWNKEKYWNLDSSERSAYETVRKKYMNYDYCADRHRYPTTPPECSQQY